MATAATVSPSLHASLADCIQFVTLHLRLKQHLRCCVDHEDKCTASDKSCRKDMWHDHAPGTDVIDRIYYSANFYTDTAMEKIQKRNQSKPFYLHLTYQSVHAPFEEPPIWEQVCACLCHCNAYLSACLPVLLHCRPSPTAHCSSSVAAFWCAMWA